jgi:hypothetical protein
VGLVVPSAVDDAVVLAAAAILKDKLLKSHERSEKPIHNSYQLLSIKQHPEEREERREKREERREKGEGRREKGEGRREKREKRGEKRELSKEHGVHNKEQT